jgi:hypothetical protein
MYISHHSKKMYFKTDRFQKQYWILKNKLW